MWCGEEPLAEPRVLKTTVRIEAVGDLAETVEIRIVRRHFVGARRAELAPVQPRLEEAVLTGRDARATLEDARRAAIEP